jgi:hypothetical protein
MDRWKDRELDRWQDITKVIFSFDNSAKAHKSCGKRIVERPQERCGFKSLNVIEIDNNRQHIYHSNVFVKIYYPIKHNRNICTGLI